MLATPQGLASSMVDGIPVSILVLILSGGGKLFVPIREGDKDCILQ